MVFLPLDVILLSFDDSNMLFSYLVVTIQKGNDQHRLLPRTKGPWYAKTSMSSSSPSSSKSSVSSKSSKKSLSSKKQKMRCFGGPVQAQVPSISPVVQTPNEPLHTVTQQPSAQDSNATSALPTLVPTESSYPTDIAVGTGSPTTSEFPASNTPSNPASIEPLVPSQSPVTEMLAFGLIQICQCDDLDICINQPLSEGTTLRLCSYATATDGIRLLPKITSLKLESLGFKEGISIIVDGTEVIDDTEQSCDFLLQKCYVSISVDDFFLFPELPTALIAKGAVVAAIQSGNETVSGQASLPFQRTIDLQKITTFNAVNGVADSQGGERSPVKVRKLALVFAVYVTVVGLGLIFGWIWLFPRRSTPMEHEISFDDDENDSLE